jgi:hypothetical protein
MPSKQRILNINVDLVAAGIPARNKFELVPFRNDDQGLKIVFRPKTLHGFSRPWKKRR